MDVKTYFSILFGEIIDDYIYKENNVYYFITKFQKNKIMIPKEMEEYIIDNLGYYDKIQYSYNKIECCYDKIHHSYINIKNINLSMYILELLIGYRITNCDDSVILDPYIYKKDGFFICKIHNKNFDHIYNIYLNNFTPYKNFNIYELNDRIIIKPEYMNIVYTLEYISENKRKCLKRKSNEDIFHYILK